MASDIYRSSPECAREGECFARVGGRCLILHNTEFRSSKCPFQKPDRQVTNGKAYPVRI